MDRRDYGLYSPGQMISGADPYGIPMLQDDGIYTYFGTYYHNPYAQQSQEYQHLQDPWQLNHRLQPLELQQNPVNGNVPRETSGDEQGDSWNDLASDDGIEFNDAAWEDQIPYSGMYQVEFQVPLGDMHPYDATGIQSDLENHGYVIFEQIDMNMAVPQDGANEGLQEDAILKNIKTRRYVKEGDGDHEPEICVVCQLDYEEKETLGILGCGHEYHSDCIKTWLLHKNVCPLCNQTAIVL